VAARSVSVLNMMTGRRGYDLRIALRGCSPSISGSATSSVTKSGLTCAMRSSATLPLATTPTTSIVGSAARLSASNRRLVDELSTTKTRMRGIRQGESLFGFLELHARSLGDLIGAIGVMRATSHYFNPDSAVKPTERELNGVGVVE
jgi:hypothetical protein